MLFYLLYLYQNALNGSVPSQIFWLKNKGGEGEWQDKQETEIKINLKEIIGEAQNRIAQHNLNENVIEGEYADKSTDTDSVRLVANKEDIKQANSK